MKISLFCSVLSVLVFSASGSILLRPHLDGRIVGGEPTTIEEFPYQISLEISGSHSCGGSIISPNVILTAAHCTRDTSLKAMRIRAGTTNRGKDGVVRTVKEKHVHELFNFQNIDYDVSLLVLNESLELSSAIKPIALPDESDYLKANESAVTTGWGATSSGGLFLPKILQKVVVPIVDQDICNDAYKDMNSITARMICAGYLGEGGKDACQGDSGGPLASNNKIHGIVSWGNGCALKKYPGVYTRVTAVREWIRSKVNL
ncbi:trypsin alpha-like [Chrysoperla carnea]|uniref:trypsin alpha-like n=1 Tax=Chrysoperla carnea TaxID=189513 RepID=UPI001D094666|nr:trypsin alpha-like [Chrysoperla carnea]